MQAGMTSTHSIKPMLPQDCPTVNSWLASSSKQKWLTNIQFLSSEVMSMLVATILQQLCHQPLTICFVNTKVLCAPVAEHALGAGTLSLATVSVVTVEAEMIRN